jgi:hypothetical protein
MRRPWVNQGYSECVNVLENCVFGQDFCFMQLLCILKVIIELLGNSLFVPSIKDYVCKKCGWPLCCLV